MLGAHHEDTRRADAPQRPADHIGRDEQLDALQRDRRVLHKVARAEETDLFQVETDEHDASPGPLFPLDERAGDFEHHGHTRRVVVGAGIEDAIADAQMVEVSRHDDPLVAECFGSDPTSRAPTLRPWSCPGTSPGIGWR